MSTTPWSLEKLGSLAAKIDYGVTASACHRPVGPKFLRITDIQQASVDWSEVPYCSAAEGGNGTKKLLAGDIVFARTGATTGKSFLIDACPEDAVFASYLIRVRPSKRINPRFLAWFFDTPAYWAQITRNAQGAAQPGVNASKLAELEIPLPPLKEQRRIATILDKADAIRRKRRQALAETDTLLRSVFLDMFGDPATDPRCIGRAPLASFGRIVTGNTPSRAIAEYFGKGIEWIKSGNINTADHFLTKAEEQLAEHGKSVARIAPAGSILVTCIAGTPECIGNAAIADRDVAFNQQINAIIPNKYTNVYFIYTHILLGKRLIQRASTKSMKGMVSKSKFAEVQFIKPTKKKQDEFGLFFERHVSYRQRLTVAARSGQEVFEVLSQRAFRGEV